MSEQSADDVIQLVDLGAACMETQQLAPFFMACDNMYAYMSYRPDGC
jgi:hypothetical protein